MKNNKALITNLLDRNNTAIFYAPRDPHNEVAKKLVRDSNNGLKIPVGFIEYLNSVPRRKFYD